MKRFFQKLTVGIVLRVVHAALVELQKQDSRVAEEFARMPEGLSYSIYTGYNGPELHVVWQGGGVAPSALFAACILHAPH